MALEDLLALEPPAADDAHLYLWATVGFLREAFELVEAWGSAGEDDPHMVQATDRPRQLLPGVDRSMCSACGASSCSGAKTYRRGSWPTAAHHSQKPESFYDLVGAGVAWAVSRHVRPSGATRLGTVGERGVTERRFHDGDTFDIPPMQYRIRLGNKTLRSGEEDLRIEWRHVSSW